MSPYLRYPSVPEIRVTIWYYCLTHRGLREAYSFPVFFTHFKPKLKSARNFYTTKNKSSLGSIFKAFPEVINQKVYLGKYVTVKHEIIVRLGCDMQGLILKRA